MRYIPAILIFLFCFMFKAIDVVGAEAGSNEVAVATSNDDGLAEARAELSGVPAERQYKTKSTRDANDSNFAVSPMVGGTYWGSSYSAFIDNKYTAGMAVEIPLSSHFAGEVEGSYARSNIHYWDPLGLRQDHSFDQYGAMGNVKVQPGAAWAVTPYVGAGVGTFCYDNMRQGNFAYASWVGLGQVFAGGDVPLGNQVSIGVRGAWLKPLIYRSGPAYAGYYVPDFEQGAVASSMFKVMGNVKVDL